jgi:hypothetical protein
MKTPTKESKSGLTLKEFRASCSTCMDSSGDSEGSIGLNLKEFKASCSTCMDSSGDSGMTLDELKESR